jgi:adenylate cyclase
MYTDMVGYTALGQRNESLSLALVEEQRKLLRPIFNRHSGTEVKTMGDAFLVEFPSALDAVRCAFDIQRATKEFNITLPSEKRIHLRVGVHLGDVVESRGDISGDAVNIASRIEPLAEDGGVCLTRQVYDQVQNKFELPLESLGSKSLKNVSAQMEVYKMVMPWHDEQGVAEARLDVRRVAVLPLVNMSPDPDDEYFADGMTEEIISTLSSISYLTVVSRTSMMQYKGAKKSLKEIGRELGAGTVLEGSLRKAGNQVRITLQMIDTAQDRHLWAQSYDKELKNVFAVQSDVAKSVAESLRVKLLPSEAKQIEKKPTDSIEAYTFYLKGRQLWNKRDPFSIADATDYFKQAVEVDPSFALGYSGLADCHFILAGNLWSERRDNLEAAKGFATKALELDGELAEAHATLAHMMEEGFELKESEVGFRRAISLKPSYATAHQWYGQLLAYQGREEEAFREIDRAVELDPLSPIIRLIRANTCGLVTRDYAKWISDLKKVQEMFPDFDVHESLASAYAYNSMFGEALEENEKGFAVELGFEDLVKFDRACIRARAGEIDELKKLLSDESVSLWKNFLPPSSLANAYLFTGDKDKAFELFEKAYVERDSGMISFKVDPIYDGIRSDPRYLALLSKIGLNSSSDFLASPPS